MKTIPASILRQLFFIILLLLLGILVFVELIPYLSGILGAITLYILLLAFMKKMIAWKWPKSLAAISLILSSFVCIILPFAVVIIMLWPKMIIGFENYHKYIGLIKRQLTLWQQSLGIDLSSFMDGSNISETLSKGLEGLAGNSLNLIISIAIMFIALYFMLTEYKDFNAALVKYSPFEKKHFGVISSEFRSKVRSNAIGIPIVAIAQGIVSLIGFFIFGIDNPFFWAVIVSVASVIPMIGGFIGIIPIFFISLSNGDNFQGWGILLYSIVFVGATDYVIRVFALKKLGGVHPLITILGVIIGIPLFGFIGLIFGPLLLSLVILLVDLYAQEYGRKQSELRKSNSKKV